MVEAEVLKNLDLLSRLALNLVRVLKREAQIEERQKKAEAVKG